MKSIPVYRNYFPWIPKRRRKRSLLLVSHQLDYSGAPLALFSMARALKELGHDVHVHTLRDGPLRQDIESLGIPVNARISQASIKAIIASTVLSIGPALRCAGDKVPVIGWIHESLEFLPLLNLDPDRLALDSLSAAVFPTEFPAVQFAPHLKSTPRVVIPYYVDQPNRPDAARFSFDYCITGPWDIRKDQSSLVSRLSELRIGARVAIIGNQRPDDFLDNGLKLTFFGEVRPPQAREIIADSGCLISNSMAETQNIAAIEALLAGRQCILSDIPVHRGLSELSPMVTLFERNQSAQLQSALQRADNQRLQTAAPDDSVKRLEERFGWRSFKSNVEALLRLALANVN